MTSKRKISSVVQKALNQHEWFPQDMIDLVKTYIDTEVKIYNPPLLPIGVRVVTAKKDEDTRALALFHQFIKLMEKKHVFVYIFTHNAERFIETSTFYHGRVVEYADNTIDEISRILMRIRNSEIGLSPTISFFLDYPSRHFLGHEKMRYMFIHAACSRLPVFILLNDFVTIPPFYWSFVSGIITRKLKDLRYYTRYYNKEKDVAEEIIEDLNMFFMFSHGIASCSKNVKTKPVRARVIECFDYLTRVGI